MKQKRKRKNVEPIVIDLDKIKRELIKVVVETEKQMVIFPILSLVLVCIFVFILINHWIQFG